VTRAIVFDHVACGVRRTADIAMLLERDLGARAYRGGPGPGFRGRQWTFAGEGKLELIEPDGEPGGFLHRFIEAGGPRIHHVTFKVSDIHDSRTRAEALGYDVVGFRDDSPAWKECFLHPKQAGGIVVQMAEADASIEDDDWQPFAAVFDGCAPRRAVLAGARLVSRSRDRSRRCWCELLGATVEAAGADEEIFRWPDSPLMLRVIYDEHARREGATALELTGFAAPLPEALPALLGTNFLQL